MMNVSVLPVLPGITAPPYVSDSTPVLDQHALLRRRLELCPVVPAIVRKGGIHKERVIDVDWISPRKRDVGAVEEKAKPVDKLADENRVFRRGKTVLEHPGF